MRQREHPATLDLDRYSVGELDPALRAQIGDHIEDCESCRTHLHDLQLRHAALMAEMPPAAFTHRVALRTAARPWFSSWWPPSTRWHTLVAAGSGMVMAALLVLTYVTSPFMGGEREPASTAGDMRMMGGFQVSAYLKSGNDVEILDRRAQVKPGDALRVQLEVPYAAHAAVFFMDAEGRVSAFAPFELAQEAVEVAAGTFTFPNSAVLDGGKTDERIFVVVRRKSFRPSEVAEEVQRAWREHGNGSDFLDDAWLPPGRKLWTVSLDKP